ncbi:hypothetical protein LTR48_006997 [Friedmanniomyces endolithicus]|uniref:AB hydrolase-1 domain-containing protein n=1 Tax=Rachicladosporium monterosium TaxID=1507873 RepID=A0ABR0LB46_9PEZI|nr:hypothetical protein LTR48_006997 [Friedmanniomyces endolithicus]KAK5146215.1 hypothetical protein LTR32_002154 [Rachicladosporium monterosium]
MNEDDTVSSTMHRGGPFIWHGPLAAWDLSSRLPEITEITVPGGILLMNGNYDTADAESVEAWSAEPKAKINHMAHFEEPQKFLAVVSGFLME